MATSRRGSESIQIHEWTMWRADDGPTEALLFSIATFSGRRRSSQWRGGGVVSFVSWRAASDDAAKTGAFRFPVDLEQVRFFSKILQRN